LHHSPSESFAGILPCLVGDGNDDENDDVGGSGSGAAAALRKEDGKIAVITTTTEHPTRKPSCHFGLHHPPIGEILPFLTQASSSSIFKSSASKTTLSSTPKPQDTSGSENVATTRSTKIEIDTPESKTNEEEEEEKEEKEDGPSFHDDSTDKNENDDDLRFDLYRGLKKYDDGDDDNDDHDDEDEDPFDLIERANILSTSTNHWTSSYLFSRASILLEKRKRLQRQREIILNDDTAVVDETSLKEKRLECRNRARVSFIKALEGEIEKKEEKAARGRNMAMLEEVERKRRINLFRHLFCGDDDIGKEEVWSRLVLCEEEEGKETEEEEEEKETEEDSCDEDTIVEISNVERSSPFHQDKYVYNNDDDSQRSSTVLVSTSTETTEASITSNLSIAALTDEREESKPVVVTVIVEEEKKVEKDCNIRGKSVSSTTAVGQQEMDEDDGEVIKVSPSISSDNKATTIPGLCNSVYDGIVVDATNAPADDHPHRFECINNMDGLDEYDECESTVGVVILEDGTVGVSPEEEDKEEEEDNGWEKPPDFTTIRHLEAQQQQTTQQHQHSNTHGGNENNKDDPWLVVIER